MVAISGRSVPAVTPGTGSFRVQQAGQLPASFRRCRQFFRSGAGIPTGITAGPAGQRDARPLHPQRPRVGLPVDRVVQHGQDMVEQVLHAHSKLVEVTLGRSGEVGAALDSVSFKPQAVVAEPHRNAGCTPVHQVKAPDIGNHLRRRPFPARFLLSYQTPVPLKHMRLVIGALLVEQLCLLLPIEPSSVEWPVGVVDESSFVWSAPSKQHITHRIGIETR